MLLLYIFLGLLLGFTFVELTHRFLRLNMGFYFVSLPAKLLVFAFALYGCYAYGGLGSLIACLISFMVGFFITVWLKGVIQGGRAKDT
ncbi:MAG: hypothetical protein D6699_03555 [Aquificota bacterium]|nr:MAG: hypothetical protein D6699_03555 [Aquificota bacterium]